MAKLKKLQSRFAGKRDATGRLVVDAHPILRGFHKPQADHFHEPMPERKPNA